MSPNTENQRDDSTEIHADGGCPHLEHADRGAEHRPEAPDSASAACIGKGSGADHRGLKPIEEMPGASPTPVLGWRGNMVRYLRDQISYLGRLRREQGGAARFVEGPNPPIVFRPTRESTSTVFALSPDAARDVLTESEIFLGGEFRAPKGLEWMNGSMVSARGERRRKRRAVMATAFTRDHLKSYLPEIVAQTDRLLCRWRERRQIDLAGDMYDLASRIASICFFGEQPIEDEPEDRETNIARLVRRFSRYLTSPLAAVSVPIPGTPYRQLRMYGEKVQNALSAKIERKRNSKKTGDDILAMMIASREEQDVRLTDREILGDAVALFLAGHDVPANAITYCLLLLSQHPDILAQVVAELDNEVEGDAPTYEQLWRLPVLDRVIKESLRVLGPTLLILRQAAETGRILEYSIPVGTEVMVCPYVIHKDPAIWDDPLAFRPDRWIECKPSTFEYLPFSYGARQCLGASFAELMMKLVICKVIRTVRLTPRSGTKVDFSCTFVISPKRSIPMRVRPQDRRFGESRTQLSGQISELVDFP